MRLPKICGLLTASALLIGANSANALELTIDDLGTAGVDVSLDDFATNSGVINYNSVVDGAVGSFSVVVSTGLGAPVVGGPNQAEIDLSVQASGTEDGSILEVTLTDTNLSLNTGASGSVGLLSDLGLNVLNNASATAESFIKIGASTVFESLSTLAGPSGNVDLVETLRRTIGTGELFDIRTVITLELDKLSFGSVDANINVAPIPLPAALPLFLTALVGLGFVGRQRRRQAA